MADLEKLDRLRFQQDIAEYVNNLPPLVETPSLLRDLRAQCEQMITNRSRLLTVADPDEKLDLQFEILDYRRRLAVINEKLDAAPVDQSATVPSGAMPANVEPKPTSSLVAPPVITQPVCVDRAALVKLATEKHPEFLGKGKRAEWLRARGIDPDVFKHWLAYQETPQESAGVEVSRRLRKSAGDCKSSQIDCLDCGSLDRERNKCSPFPHLLPVAKFPNSRLMLRRGTEYTIRDQGSYTVSNAGAGIRNHRHQRSNARKMEIVRSRSEV